MTVLQHPCVKIWSLSLNAIGLNVWLKLISKHVKNAVLRLHGYSSLFMNSLLYG